MHYFKLISYIILSLFLYVCTVSSLYDDKTSRTINLLYFCRQPQFSVQKIVSKTEYILWCFVVLCWWVINIMFCLYIIVTHKSNTTRRLDTSFHSLWSIVVIYLYIWPHHHLCHPKPCLPPVTKFKSLTKQRTLEAETTRTTRI